jgi:hypothetical protein
MARPTAASERPLPSRRISRRDPRSVTTTK